MIKDKIILKENWRKLASENLNDPINEEVFIKQSDIEELDDKLIKIVPKK